jgi:hypothetical protein
MTRKLSEHVEEELFNKEKRVIPNVPPEYRVKLNEGVDSKKVIKTTPVIRKESVLGSVEVVFEPEKKYTFLEGFLPGFGIGLIIGVIIKSLM